MSAMVVLLRLLLLLAEIAELLLVDRGVVLHALVLVFDLLDALLLLGNDFVPVLDPLLKNAALLAVLLALLAEPALLEAVDLYCVWYVSMCDCALLSMPLIASRPSTS